MKIIRHIEIEEEELQCDTCEEIINKKDMWRAFIDGCIIEDGNYQSLDFCSKKCATEWIKKNVGTEPISTDQVKEYKKDLEGEEDYD